MKVFEWIERQVVEWASGRRGNIIRARSLTNWNRCHSYEPRYPTQLHSTCICGRSYGYCERRDATTDEPTTTTTDKETKR